MRNCPRRSRWFSLLPLLLLLQGGCEVTAEDISRWKHTAKGPAKLRDALKDGDLSVELRAQAAVAMIEIGMSDEVQGYLQGLPESARRPLARKIIPVLVSQLQQSKPGAPPAKADLEAKDGLYRLRLLCDVSDRALADDTLIAWTTGDLMGRMSAGAYDSQQILSAIGSRAQGALLAILSGATLDTPALLPAASLLGRVGDPEAKRSGAEQLIKLLQPVLASGQLPERKVDELLRATGQLGGPAAGHFLSDLAERGPLALRDKALAALRETGDPVALDLALRLATDRKEVPRVREAAFAYLEKVGQIAVAGLLKIVTDPKDGSEKGEITRFRAVEAALSAGGPATVVQVLEALPEGRAYSREDMTAYVVHQLTPLGAAARPAVRQALQSKSWVARAAALLALGEMGQAADEAAIQALSGDPARLRGAGWQVATIGELAKEQAQRLKNKK